MATSYCAVVKFPDGEEINQVVGPFESEQQAEDWIADNTSVNLICSVERFLAP